jgi:hypothetical protein
MLEARLEDTGSGLAPAEDGWLVVKVHDARLLTRSKPLRARRVATDRA